MNKPSTANVLIPNEYKHYHSINSRNQDIRLLRILPESSPEEGIVVCLTRTTLSSKHPEYCALSYCWGSLDNTKQVIVVFDDGDNGSDEYNAHPQKAPCTPERAKFNITTNLHDALLSLHKSDKQGLFWIDMLCINQGDLEERSQQVRFMTSIYSSAHLVLIWLGNDPQVEEALFDPEHYDLAVFDLLIEEKGWGNISNLKRASNLSESEAGAREPSGRSYHSEIVELLIETQSSVDARRDWYESPPYVPSSVSYTVPRFIYAVVGGHILRERGTDGDDDDTSSAPRDSSTDTPTHQSPGDSWSFKEASTAYFSRIISPNHLLWKVIHRAQGYPKTTDVFLHHDLLKHRFPIVARLPWLRRIWVIQEALTNSRVRVRAGSTEGSWQILLTLFRALSAMLYESLTHFTVLQNGEEANIIWMWQRLIDMNARKKMSSYDLSAITRRFRASDDRDRVIALLGLMTDTSNHFKANYSMSTEEVFARYTLDVVQSTQSLRILFVAPLGEHGNSELRLPSWVPDFRHDDDRETFSNLCQVSGQTQLRMRTNTSWRHLHLGGFVITKVKRVITLTDVKTFVASSRKRSETRALTLPNIWTYLNYIYDQDFPRTVQDLEFARRRKLSLGNLLAVLDMRGATEVGLVDLWFGEDPDLQSAGMTEVFRLDLRRARKRFDEKFPYRDIDYTWVMSKVLNFGMDNSFYLSEDGNFGRGPATAQSGDIVAGIYGFPVPVILRPRVCSQHQVMSDHQPFHRYKIVGLCTLSGVMDGEVIDGPSWQHHPTSYLEEDVDVMKCRKSQLFCIE
ncbi:heterokaryon incompatibility protein-domain-containing protein [Xylariaceae sp. FL0662B]|nr:heterokaryon incompatibility protein-domain-containing protein [Xylariaceae sp. FL0662B]